MLPRGLLIVWAIVLCVPLGCGGNDEDGSTGSASVSQSETRRPELAFFTTHGNAIYELGIADDRGSRLRIVSGESKPGKVFPQLFTSVSWSPSGERIAFAGVSGSQTDEHDEPTDVYAVDADGSDTSQISDVGDARGPLWSPDGKTIAFTRMSTSEGQPLRGSLWSIGVDGEDLTELVKAADWKTYTAGSFTSDESQLALTRTRINPESGKATARIELMNSDGSDRAELIERASDPAFSPDGKHLAFVSDRDKNGELCDGERCSYGQELYVADSDGSKPVRMTKTRELNEAHPAWRPDGSRIAYQRGKVFANAEAFSILELNRRQLCPRDSRRVRTWSVVRQPSMEAKRGA